MPTQSFENSASATATLPNYETRCQPEQLHTPPEPVTSVLSVSSQREDHTLLEGILTDPSWVVCGVRTYQEARVRLCRERMPIVICDCTLSDGTWKDILSMLAGVNQPPLLIVASRLADERLWAEVLNLGGFDVLAKPFHPTEVQYVVDNARRYWQCRNVRTAAAGSGSHAF